MKKANLPPDPEKMNKYRAKRAHDMMQKFWRVSDDVPEHPFAEILCDLMHWSDRNGVHFDDNLTRARIYYSLETSRCIDIFVKALNAIAAGKGNPIQIAADALQSAPNGRAKFDPVRIPF